MPQPSFDQPLKDLSFVAFDTETTGLSPTLENLIELAAVRFSLGDDEGEAFGTLIDPGRSIPDASSRVHGIHDDDVVGKPKALEVLEEFGAFCEGAVLLAHNAEFDVTFMTYEADRGSLNLPRLPILDTVEIARSVRGDLPNHKLETLSKVLGCHASTYHRALADAQTTARCFNALVDEGYQGKTLADLVRGTGSALTFGEPDRLRMWLPPALQPLDEAFDRGDKVTIVYSNEGRREEAREVRPRGYMRRPGVTYLMAFCERDRADRTFRLDTIRRAHFAQATLF